MIGARENREAEAFDAALRGARTTDADIAALVRAAELVTASAVVEPSADFVRTLRAQVVADAAEVLVVAPPTAARTAVVAPRRTARRRLAGLTAVAITAVGGVSLMASSAQALPGDMLYPVKRHVESAELALHHGDASRGSFQLSQAEERLSEATTLAQKDPSSTRTTQLVADTLSDFSDQASAGSQDLFAAYGSDKSDALINKVNDFAAASSINLAKLVTLLPSTKAPEYQEAAQTVASMADQASTLCTSCKTADVSSLAATVKNLLTGKKTGSGSDADTSTSATKTVKPSAAATTPAGSAATTPAPTVKTTKPVIAPPPTTPPHKLSDVTDPVIGALLGDDNQTGLVPGLIDLLTGQTSK